MRMQKRLMVLLFSVVSAVLVSVCLPGGSVALETTLAWNPNTDTGLAGYKFYYGFTSRVYQPGVNVENLDLTNPTYKFTNHEPGRVHYYAVTAYDSYGNESDYSNEVVEFVQPLDSDGDGISDDLEDNYYGTNKYLADTDGDGISDGDEVLLLGINWNLDQDGDGLDNLHDPDADGDGNVDGMEYAMGSDFLSAASLPPIVLEDAQKGHLKAWTKSSSTAVIQINPPVGDWYSEYVYLFGAGRYTLYKYSPESPTLLYWDVTTHKVIYLELKTLANFYVCVEFLNESNGLYKIYYMTTIPEGERRISGTNIQIGISSNYKNGNKYSLARDLRIDLAGVYDTNGREVTANKIRLVTINLFSATPTPWFECDPIKLMTELPPQLP